MNKDTPKKRRVLVIDDEEAIRTMLGAMIEQEGHEVAFALDGEEGLAQAAAFMPELIILDIMMPRMHGLEVLKRLKADPKTQGIKVIVFSAKDFKGDQARALELGALMALPKPMKYKEFVKILREVLPAASAAPQARTPPAEQAVSQPGALFLPKIRKDRGSVHFWGTRGSTPVSGQAYVRHGGNTSCVSVEYGDDMVILDAGTGIRQLGEVLAAGKPCKLHIFVTHTHWDHIQGFPFFLPAYSPGFELFIYGAKGFGKDLKQIFQGQLDRDYFPAQIEDMRAKIEFRQLSEGPARVGELQVYWEYVHHPGAAVGYKIDVKGRKVGYVSDNEFLKGYLGDPGAVKPGDEVLFPYKGVVAFLSDVELLLAEAQYTNGEYEAKIGWGHSSLSNACVLARLAGVKRWVVTHHEPRYGDSALHSNLNLTRQILGDLGQATVLSHAFDGMTEFL